ncbi:hypothetical protein G166_gp13 [Clostridium phage phi8074-B1]|uniref:hypothetical protein n=1 Tax=Clostridium phage phi8074-B1 TaxID=1147137 RepID=UPI00025C0C40|nr:hypothetical protein G166_gp13 [Clostridium phage phi8074-B1]AFC61945.1 hypothetical protein phi8074-B1_00013 [Clostridium phage phi8074-B1]
MTMYEAKLLMSQYEKDKLRLVNDMSFAVAYGISGALNKKGYKPIKAKETQTIDPHKKKETLKELFNEMGG